MAVQIQLRNDTAANWASVNPTLAQGELGLEIDTNKIKIGQGNVAWNDLAYSGIDPAELVPLLSYTHNQSSASDTWTVVHGLGFYPAVSIFDSAANAVEGAVTHNSINHLTIQFSAATSGTAYLS